jgi:transposase
MFVKQVKTSKGKVYVEIVEGFRNELGKPGHRVVKKLGYLDKLDASHGGNGLSWAKEEANRLGNELLPEKEITLTSGRTMDPSISTKKNIGYLSLKPIYKTLELSSMCSALQAKHPKANFKFDDVLQFLIYSKIVDADSKLSSFTRKGQYIDSFPFSEEEMYRALETIGESWEQIKDFAYSKTKERYGVNLSLTHYDGCNFYFEIDKEDELRKKGPSKEGRVEPIVGIGLLSDADMLPIDLKIYPGNESEKPHFTEVIDEMRSKHKITGRTIYVADRGLNTGNNIYSAMKNGDGYIYGQTIQSEKARKWALLDKDYKVTLDKDGTIIYKEKSWIDDEAYVNYIGEDKKSRSHKTTQKQIVFWSKDYSDKQKAERAKLINKARAFIGSPKGYTRSKIGDAATFIKFASFDKETGEYKEGKDEPILDIEAINKQAELDGYFMVVSSETKMSDKDILDAYSAQKGEERSFRVSKTYLKIRPVYVSRESRIKCHILISYLALLFLRIMEQRILKKVMPIEEIIDSIREYQAASIAPNVYFFFSYNHYVDLLASQSGSTARLETQSLGAIKKMFKGY